MKERQSFHETIMNMAQYYKLLHVVVGASAEQCALDLDQFPIAVAVVKHFLQVASQHLHPAARARVVVDGALLPFPPAQQKGDKVVVEAHERPRVPEGRNCLF